ncbi:MAG TPA: FKBP-type peptidyl-prolyl cis-trans isomerase [Polyangiaceae bacterium]|nr:FKBP-type peptidyl-prolyl cis-trans isomerase [Polyangiaceae bacterium]
MLETSKALGRALLFGSLAFLGVSACASAPTPAPAQAPQAPSPQDDQKAILAQELGDAPAPAGPCPERTDTHVLENPRAAVHRTALGLAYCILQEGPPGSTVPGASDTVKVHYTGWTIDGEMFDSSVERGEPIDLPLNGVIRGWTEGLRLMTPGDKARLWIPGNLGYGRREPGEAAGTPPKGTLIFDIELLAVTREPTVEAPKEEASASDDSRPKLNPRLPQTPEKPKRQGRRQDGPQMRTSSPL